MNAINHLILILLPHYLSILNTTTYTVLGLMSGTSLDGLDMACCTFDLHQGRWLYRIEKAQTYSYTEIWKKRFAEAMRLSSKGLLELHRDFARLMSEQVNLFLVSNNMRPDFIASHGHTVFHQPAEGITLQIGDGSILAAETGITTICDFRSADVALGGQGAPLVPIGDRMLFSESAVCLNLGGIANISFDQGGLRRAYDVVPCNIPLNRLAISMGMAYDAEGGMARSGAVNDALLSQLNALSYYHRSYPKSLGMEWIIDELNPLLEASSASTQDKLRTLVEHTAIQIARSVEHLPFTNEDGILITGGGALNSFLIERISDLVPMRVLLPDLTTIQFKEALIFAFLGLLRMRGEVNTLASVTGARRDSCGGSVYAGASV